jgi:hypothetical protein
MSYYLKRILLSLGLLLVVETGCQETVPSDIPQLYPVTVTVMLNGTPLPEASLSLKMVDHDTGLAIVGKTDSSGIAQLWTQGRYRGAPAGKYKVTVRKSALVEGATSKTPPPNDPKELDAYKRKVEAERKSYPAIEERFSKMEKTVLEMEVVPNQKNVTTFEVQKIVDSPPF